MSRWLFLIILSLPFRRIVVRACKFRAKERLFVAFGSIVEFSPATYSYVVFTKISNPFTAKIIVIFCIVSLDC
jgi:hypothetical protein